jgi:hypothetical protein
VIANFSATAYQYGYVLSESSMANSPDITHKQEANPDIYSPSSFQNNSHTIEMMSFSQMPSQTIED